MLSKDDGQLDFSQPATTLARRVRAFNPWPGAFTFWQGQLLKIHRAHPAGAPPAQPGMTALHGGQPALGCGDGLLVLDEVQPAGKRPMPGEVFLHGAKNWGSRLAGE
jgi:methionyl-tRNA formyltransferase